MAPPGISFARFSNKFLLTSNSLGSGYLDTVKAAHGRFEYLQDSLHWQTFEMTPGRPFRAFEYLKKALVEDSTYVDLHPAWHSKVLSGEQKVADNLCSWSGCYLLQVEPDDSASTTKTFSALQPFSHGEDSSVAAQLLLAQVEEVEAASVLVGENGSGAVVLAVEAWLSMLTSHLLDAMRPSLVQARQFSAEAAEEDLERHQELEANQQQLLELLVIHSV